MESVWSVSKLSTESVGSRRELCSHRRRDETRQFRLVGVGGVYWTLVLSQLCWRLKCASLYRPNKHECLILLLNIRRDHGAFREVIYS